MPFIEDAVELMRGRPWAQAAVGGAALGAAWGLYDDYDSVLGSAVSGAVAGGIIAAQGSRAGMVFAGLGAAYNMYTGGSAGMGALGGAAVYHAGRFGLELGRFSAERYRGYTKAGFDTARAVGAAGRDAWENAYERAAATYDHIGATVEKAYNGFMGIASNMKKATAG